MSQFKSVPNVRSWQGVISFTEEELKGVPKDVVSGYTKRAEGDIEFYDVTFKTPDIFPVVSHIESSTSLFQQVKFKTSLNLLKIRKPVKKLKKVMKRDLLQMSLFLTGLWLSAVKSLPFLGTKLGVQFSTSSFNHFDWRNIGLTTSPKWRWSSLEKESTM